MNKKIYIFILVVCIVLTGSLAAWLYLESDIPKKEPAKAKSVFFNKQ